MIRLKRLTEKFVQTCFPRRCPICKEIPISTDAAQLCEDCAAVFAADLHLRCPKCRLPAPDCLCTPRQLKGITSAMDGRSSLTTAFYLPGDRSSYVNKLIYALKTDNEDTAARVFAQMMSREILLHFTRAGKNVAEWIITYPPRRAEKKDELCFDQAERLARMCAEYTGARFARLFVRQGGAEQKLLNSAERTENTKSAFRLKKASAIRGTRVILCDDVLTTGATLAACASLLKDAGAEEIAVVTAAKTLRREQTEKVISDMSWFNEK